jgi:hypothetical protein
MGGTADLVLGRRICMTAVEELDRVLQRVIVLAFLGQERGRVRFLGLIEAHACRGRGQRGSWATARISSSLHNKTRVSSFLLCYRSWGGSGCLGRVRWWCGNRTGVKGRAERGCGLLFQRGMWGMLVRSVWLVGSIGGLWLVKSDGGRVREGQRDALLKKVWLLHALNKVWQDFKICKCLSNSYLQALEDKEERVMLQYISSRGVSKCSRGQSGGLVKFQIILN